ncbi:MULTISPECIES: RrF2 family transcriptional regulator [Lachnospiraceae]|uniref:RrF2 family transcriptional regulator n=1 Tax=Lachnospiraceae TaxID=186803 RepID=UPI001F297A54|nr:RrF2 family transcriptional regulator [Faecalicatena contorta]MCI6120166.1 RrF2 family transcriptional regulator [Lachnospiraceae bacterium]MCF2668245.1 RrF2 family transcriptional regulator [Faecalicatena contorta]MCI6534349.1 RrF2 family transcriptional regulator [Lachnospiraceae bacterium]MDY2612598.1 RrF2 family transcriptional regulator [Lachnospiraceae bacterium]MDY4206080.1 RrF2 family transcriptional regulator [Lachnospiraceae bacterium]
MISTKARYALRVMIDLAQNQQDGYIPLKDIAARQDISEKYLEIILKALVKGKIIKGLRGKGGGYMLTRSPEEYVIGEIIELTEGPLAPVACMLPDADPCPRKDTCMTLPLWQKYDSVIHDFFYNITLEDVLNGNL